MSDALRPAVFLDRDGTIAEYVEYCRRPEELRLLPGVGEAIRRLNESGLLVLVVTNQSAVGRGWLTHAQLEAIHAQMRRALALAGARLDGIYVCPHHPDQGCACRKPASGLFEQAAAEHQIALPASFMIGDRALDVLSGHRAGCSTILVRTGHEPEPLLVAPHFDAQTLAEAVEWILTTRLKSAVIPQWSVDSS